MNKINYKRIFNPPGEDQTLPDRVTSLENHEYKIAYFESVAAATGTVTKPVGSTILLDQFASGADAYVSTIVNGQPTGIFPQTAGGVAVDVSSFDTLGNYTLSGTPSAFNVAIIYIIKIPALYLDNAVIANRLDLEDINAITPSQLQNSADKYAVATGTDTYLVTLTPTPATYEIGQSFWIKIPNTNTVTNPTLNVNSLGAKTIKGANSVALPIGFFTAGGNYNFIYDGTDFICQAGLMDRKCINYYRKTGTTTYERWYTFSNVAFVPTTSTSYTQNTMRAVAFIVSKTITLDRIAMEITTIGTAASVVRIGIYDDVNGVPTNLILDAGTIAGDSASFQSITINQTLTPGLYWLTCLHNSGSGIIFRAVAAAQITCVTGVPSTLGSGTIGGVITSTQAYGTLPAIFSTTAIAVSVLTPAIISVRLSA